MFIKIENISKKYGEKYLFTKVNMMLTDSHRVGLVGKNGAGKTTFLKILTGELKPDFGKISIDPAKAKIVYHQQVIDSDIENTNSISNFTAFSYLMSQDSEKYKLWESINSGLADIDYAALIEEYTQKNGYEYEDKIIRALKRLKLDPQKEIKHLSGGQKTRLQLAKLLIDDADVLLLDEPTNHLDIDGIEWFYNYIENFKGIVIIATHDRNLLNGAINKIIDFSDEKLTEYSGNYDYYRKEKLHKRIEAENKIRNNERRVEELNEAAKKLKERIERHEKRAKEIEDKTIRVARLTKKNRAANTKIIQKKLSLYRDNDKVSANFKLNRQAVKLGANRRSILSKARDLAPAKQKLGWSMKLEFDTKKIESDFVLKVEDFSKSYDGKEVIKDFNFELMKNRKIALVGPNGSGKSTLLRCIAGDELDYEGQIYITQSAKIGYLEQETKSLNNDATVLDNFLASAGKIPESEARGFLHFFLFEGDMSLRKVETLSEGEKLKLKLAKLLYSKANLLLLDEPTNHLDIDSQEVIEKALRDYDGSMIIVSHDKVLLENIGINKLVEF